MVINFTASFEVNIVRTQ